MRDEEFNAPDWVTKNEGNENTAMSKTQKTCITIFIFLFIPFSLWAGWFELARAQQGHWRAWVYAFEWPAFGFLGIYLWRKLMRGESLKFHIPTPQDRGIKSDEE